MRTLVLLLAVAVAGLLAFRSSKSVSPKEKLSEYGFFSGKMAELVPASGVVEYSINTALFSNYAEKLRFIRLPEGQRAEYHDSSVFTFPVGTVLIKNFYYPNDFRKPEKGRFILETRLLVNTEHGWEAWPYIWNNEQTEAYYDPAGETRTVRYINLSGKKVSTPYVIPNKNQCKGCHMQANTMVPIGPTARQLNKSGSNGVNQLRHWQELNLINGLPDVSQLPSLAVWDDPSTGSLEERARAYLDANCGHCHSREGAANTSGLFLDIFEQDKSHLGILKSPVAAGRGAGDLQYDIKPGEPQNSILIFRMKTNDPAIAMPEIGREQVHEEGVELIEEWIRKSLR